MKVASLLLNKWTWIALGILIVVYMIYKYGRDKGEQDALECSWWEKLKGECNEDGTKNHYVINHSGEWTPASATDRIHQAYEAYSSIFGGGDRINTAWAVFNTLDDGQKTEVVNTWESKYKGTDRDGIFTGNYGTLRETILIYSGDLVPEAETALNWLNAMNIQ